MKDHTMRLAKISVILLTLISAYRLPGQVSVLTQHNDNARTGQNLSETTLNTSNVNQSTFGKLFWRTVDGFIFAQPLYVPGLTIQGATHNVVFVATQHNSVYAFDADDPNSPAPLWQINLGNPVPMEDICILTGDNNPGDCPYYDISPEIGITSTPAIDPIGQIIYVVNRTKNVSDGSYHVYLHALNLTTGSEELGGPVEITGQVSGTGTGNVGGVITFDPTYHNQRPSLLLSNGVLYIAFGSVGDIGTWHGWVMSYNASTLQQESIFNVAPDGSEGGIWSSGQGLIADASGNVYLMTGNGDFNANLQGGRDYGDSFVKFSGPSLAVTDYFTPFNQGTLNADNTDLGAGGPMLMPNTGLLVGQGKDSVFRVVNSTNMGRYNSSFDNDVQEFTATTGPFFSSPVYWNSPNLGPLVYLWGPNDFLKAFQFTGSQFNSTPASQGTIQLPNHFSNAAALSLSANGSLSGSGILWTSATISGRATGVPAPGVIRAFDATNLTRELWDSTQNLARDDVGNYAKFVPPTVANGKVYAASFNGQLQVYGLNPPAFQGIQFVQVASATPQSNTTSVSVAYPQSQTAGNLNVVIVGWNDSTASVQSVSDSLGNTYTAVGTVLRGTSLSQAIYYAKNISSGSGNTVTVTFNQAAVKPDLRILEYSGVDPSNPLDVTAGASGNSYIADSGYIATRAANELIVGADMVSGNTTIMGGAPLNIRVITTTDSDLAADYQVNVPGSYHTWAPLNASGPWLMQAVTFRSATVSAVPFVTSVTPNTGAVGGGTSVTITGMDFVAGASVTFGGAAATNVVVVNATTITATTPAGSPGPVTVTVTDPSGLNGSLTDGFTYVPAPAVNSVSPTSGSTSGGTAVTIAGSNFLPGATVTFGGTAATNVVVMNSTTITATTPAHAAGAVTVTVTNPGGQAGSLTNGFTYVNSPTVTSVSPNSGPVGGGTAVTITGTNFVSGATVAFGSNAATNVVVVSSTSITATTPAGTAGAVTVTVTDPGGLNGSLANGFTYIGTPTVTSVAPNNGPTGGGTAVTIAGTNFVSGATVTFGSNAATNVAVVSSTSITATTPAGSAGAVTVTVTNPGGLNGSLANGFTYTTQVAIGFVQVAAATPQSAVATVPVAYPGAQTQGDLNVVVVGWNDTTSTVQSVSDSVGNTYSLAIGPTSGTGLRQSIYYAANIAGGTNTVTVTFNQAAAYPDVRVLEYRGATTLDVVAGASGNSASANSGSATTTSANELIFGANTVATGNAAAGSGFTLRIITTPDLDLAEDKVVTTAGSTSATATLTASGPWVMQMATFSAVSGPVPTVTSVSPSSGTTAGGTAVTITGTNFATGATVTFGGTAATNVVVVSSTSITATTPAGNAGPVTVTVINPGGQSGNLANGFTYVAPPTVTSVSPNTGTTAGGTAVTITGTNFATGATVTFGGTAATNVVVVSSTSITATTPAHAAGAVTVVVTNTGGLNGSLANGFTYAGTPTVTSVSPNSGSISGGTAVTITGTNFATGATVTFGGTAATNVVVVSSTSITATTPAHAAGAVTVVVTNTGGLNGSLTNGFTYVNSPTVTSVSPNSGTTAGGTAVTITGTNFATGATVTFGGTAATNVVVVSSTSITATTPAHAAGAVTVAVTNTGGLNGSLANGFTYVGTPTVASVSPNNGPTGGGTAVTIAGTNFAAGATVTFGGTAATNVVVVNSTSITATTPAHAVGAVTVTVTNPGGLNGSLANGFTYVGTPTVASVSPNSGTTAGGTAVTITGTNFTAGATVTFGGTAATNVVVVSGTSITATTPTHAAGAVTVKVTNPGGLNGSLTNGFTYVAPPTVTSVSPNTGTTAGGTAVTITGTNFATGATVTFGGTAATNVVVVSSTSITATTPAHAAGAVTVVVTNTGGLNGSLANGFTYAGTPTVTSVSPNSGSISGGTAVTITGTNFATGATVTFGGTAATNVVVVSSTSITATTPAHAAGAVTVVVTNTGGLNGSLTNGFTYVNSPTVTSVSPNSGTTAGGTAVTITGTNFATGATVTFGGTAATNVVVVSSTSITATTPAHAAGAVTVAVTNTGGLNGSLANGFTYVGTPTVASVSPNNGPTGGGTAVTIAGTNFAAGATVTFGGTAATNVVVVNSTSITATTPAHAVGAVTVTVTNPGGLNGSLANGFTYTTQVAIGFVQVAAATPQSSVATVPVTYPGAQAQGDLNVVVVGWNDTTSTVQSVSDSVGNTYSLAIGPTSGTGLRQSIYYAANIAGGTNTVTVTFNQAAAYPDVRVLEYRGATTLDIVAGASGSSASANSGSATTTSANELIFGANTVSTGNAAAGSGFTSRIITNPDSDLAEDKVVTAAGSNSATATLTASGPWVMQMVTFSTASGPVPTVTSVSPSSGSTAGGTPVTITGTNFATGATVTFGGTAATNVVVVSNTSITATTPAGNAGPVTVTVTSPGGQIGNLTNGYTYVLGPNVTGVSPNYGPVAGGTAVTITGANFASGATVTFAGIAATNVVVVNSTTITATTPAGNAGVVSVTVTVSGQAGSLNGFTYIAQPSVTSVSPNTGTTLGGTAVSITGTNFASGATVTFGSNLATNVVVVNSTTITAVTPVGTAGAVTVTVTNLGPQSGSLANGYTYIVTAGLTAPGNFSGALAGTTVPVYVAGQQYYNATPGTSFTSSPFNSTGADLLVMFLGCHNNTIFTITDSYGNTWLPLAGPAFKVGTANYPMEGEFFYVPNARTGAGHTITVNLSQTEPLVMSIAALTGDNIYSPIDSYSSINGDNGTQTKYVGSPSVATSQPNDLLLGIVKGFGANTYTAGAGFTNQAASTGTNFSAETGAAPTAANYNSSFVAANQDFWQSVVAAVAPNPNNSVLSWSASTGGIVGSYLVERCSGLNCSNFTQIGSVNSPTLTYTDSTVASGTIYNYRVRAESTTGTFSAYSTVQALSPITPYVVTSLATTPSGTLNWNASAEQGGSVSQYAVERCTGAGCTNFAPVATTSSTSYVDSSVIPGTTYNYRVRAQDSNNFYGPYSAVVPAIVPSYFDNVVDGGNNGGSSSSLTYAFTVGTNANRLLLVNIVGDTSADDISSVTYAGAPMTRVTKVQTPGSRWHYLYYLLSPASGSNNVVITAASSHYLISEGSSWYNIAQSGQPAASSTSTLATGTTLTTSLPAPPNGAIAMESMWGPMQLLPSYGSIELMSDAAFQSLGMFAGVPSPTTQAYPMSMTNTWGGQDAASGIMASFTLASNGPAGITYDNSIDGGNNAGSTTSLTYSYTVGSGANRLLLVNLIGDPNADDITSVTYGGAALTLLGKVRSASNNWQYLYYLLNPTSGAHNVVVAAATAHSLISQAASWYNVRQTGQPDAFATNTDTVGNTSFSSSLTTVAPGDLVVEGLWSYGHLAAGPGATPIVIDATYNGAGIFVSSGSPVPSPGLVPMTSISDGALSSGGILASFAPAP